MASLSVPEISTMASAIRRSESRPLAGRHSPHPPSRDFCGGFRDSAMTKLPPRRTQFGVRDLPQLVMGKVVRFVPLHLNDPALPELIEQRNESIFIGMTGSGKQFRREGCP